MAGAQATGSTRQAAQGLLGIYLNDHLAGATGGVELARRVAAARREEEAGDALLRFAADVAADRATLLEIMTALGVPVRAYKVCAGWIGEKAGRLKLNGRLLSRSPLSSLEELEMMCLGVAGKAAGWRTLRVLADTDPRLDRSRLDDLIARADSQLKMLEDLRVRAARSALGQGPAGA
ncbi:MAG TPA: hypothetical protein VFJ07_15630 [Streptosporangiaceae bacterium]|nr:hypothetical protein [Streptosporangiaceae bacterium]